MPTSVADPTPYPYVNTLLQDVLARVQAILGPRFLGMYLYGSLALGDFTPLRSDIDYVVVSDGELSDEQVAALGAMHADLGTTYVPWGSELEGSYIPLAVLRRPDRTPARYPSIERGETLRVEAHAGGRTIQRYLLREYGIRLAGPPIQGWIDPVRPADLRRDVLEIAQEWLTALHGTPDTLRHRGYQGYIVLTICRMLYTLEFGTIVSKPAAARWALGALDARWAPLIERALAEDTEETLALIADTLERVQAYALPGDEDS